MGEKCTIHRIKMRNLTDTDCLLTCDSKRIQKLSVRLSDLKDFDQPMIVKKRWGKRKAEMTTHITPERLGEVIPPFSDLGWSNYLILFAMTWIMAKHDRALRIHTYFAYSNSKDETPFETIWTVDFIEFGDRAKTPECLNKLWKCLEKLEGNRFSPAVYPTLNQQFPNCVSEDKEINQIIGSESFWMQLESNFQPDIAVSKTKPTWLDSGIDLKVDASKHTRLEWMNDTILCFTFLAKMYPDFGIVMKKVGNDDTKLTFFIQKGNLSHFSIFLGTFTIFLNEIVKEKTSVTVLKACTGLIPFVGSCLSIKDSIDAFKSGHEKTGWFCLVMGVIGLVADVVLDGGQMVSLTAKLASSSTKVVTACNAITNATSKVQKLTRYSTNAITCGQEMAGRKALECSSSDCISLENVSNVYLLKIVFPRLAEDISSKPP